MSTPMHDKVHVALHLPMERALPPFIMDTKAVQYVNPVERLYVVTGIQTRCQQWASALTVPSSPRDATVAC